MSKKDSWLKSHIYFLTFCAWLLLVVIGVFHLMFNPPVVCENIIVSGVANTVVSQCAYSQDLYQSQLLDTMILSGFILAVMLGIASLLHDTVDSTNFRHKTKK